VELQWVNRGGDGYQGVKGVRRLPSASSPDKLLYTPVITSIYTPTRRSVNNH